jgi:callose synthase
MHPGLRVAYVDRTPSRDGREATYDAVLLTSDDAGVVCEAGRVRLPGNPILGEGKPENQNVAMPFTRGEKVCLIDMNQDGYFEEALKVCSRDRG